ncbi:MAG: MOSC domain-containing protein [Nitrospinaceae bacterium]
MRSAINKKPVSGKIFLDTLGFQGDGIGNPKIHGGKDKAVCVYCLDHFPFWESELGRELLPGAFGENLSVSGITEKDVRIGDRFRVGEAEVQCTQPRQPCRNLNSFMDEANMVARVKESGYTGFYMRVLKTGWVEPGIEFELLERQSENGSVEAANILLYKDKLNFQKIREFLANDSLSESWREIFNRLLNNKSSKDFSLNSRKD